jgi:hypothetical protein
MGIEQEWSSPPLATCFRLARWVAAVECAGSNFEFPCKREPTQKRKWNSPHLATCFRLARWVAAVECAVGSSDFGTLQYFK